MNEGERTEAMAVLQLDVEVKAEQQLRNQSSLLGVKLRTFVFELLVKIDRHRGDVSKYSSDECDMIVICAATYLVQLYNVLAQEDEDE